jgi:ATP-dependent RNA helicase RhlE
MQKKTMHRRRNRPHAETGVKHTSRPQTTTTKHTHTPLNGVFSSLIPPIQQAVSEQGYTEPTPIQEQSITPLLEGRDLIGCAQTGTGKTAAFVLPILQHFTKNIAAPEAGHMRALILAPTRELAAQIGDSIACYGRHLDLNHTVIFGGVGQAPQVRALRRGLDVVVATPGRLLDLMNQGHLTLKGVEVFVLDEADRMLDMGFLPDIRRIIAALPRKRQSLFFSATMEPKVMELARTLVHKPVNVAITPKQPAVERIVQKMYFVDKARKQDLLLQLLQNDKLDRIIVFTRMKHAANRLTKKLVGSGFSAEAIHGDKSQGARTKALSRFKSGSVRILVATDIAARGIDVDDVSHVVNYDLPNEAETYVHRIGRTARAGSDGDAISFCSATEREYLRDIEKLIRTEIPVITDHEFHSEAARTATGADACPPAKK